MTASKIQWTDRSDWNPVRGCTRHSQGCVNCYAETIAGRFTAPGQPFHGFAERTPAGPRWTGRVEVIWDRIDLPLRWRKPVRIFANSASDLFHESLKLIDIAEIFGVMIAAHHLRGHTFQVLTKRADVMRETLMLEDFWEHACVEAERHVMALTDPLDRRRDDARAALDDYGPDNPPPGIWLGVSVEDQAAADERIPDLLAIPAAVRWLSCEPLLGPVDLRKYMWPVCKSMPAKYRTWDEAEAAGELTYHRLALVAAHFRFIDWVVAGGESGKHARPMHPDWARSLRDQCQSAGVPFFFKQWGEWSPYDIDDHGFDTERLRTRHVKSHAGEHSGAENLMVSLGKTRAGRLLDGREWSEFPA